MSMMRSALRASAILLDGRNRFPVNIHLSQTRKRNDRKRLTIMQENAAIIREGRLALLKRLAKERQQADAMSPTTAAAAAAATTTTTTANASPTHNSAAMSASASSTASSDGVVIDAISSSPGRHSTASPAATP